VQEVQYDALVQGCIEENANAVQNSPLIAKISSEHVVKLRLGMMTQVDYAQLLLMVDAWWRYQHCEAQLATEVRSETERRRRRALAATRWDTDQSRGFAEMTKPKAIPASCSLQTIVAEVRDRGSMAAPGRPDDLADTERHFGPHYAPHSSEQYSGQDLLTGWDASAVPVIPETPADAPLDQLGVVTRAQLQNWRDQRESEEGGLERWLCTGQPPPPFEAQQVVIWPDRLLPYERIAGMIATMVVNDTRDGLYDLLDDNTLRFVYSDPSLLASLHLEGLTVNDQVPDTVIATDGSGSGTVSGDTSPCGFGTLVITARTITVLMGGTTRSTSGLMELAAGTAGFQHVAEDNPSGLVLLISDYKTLVDADLDRLRGQHFKSLQNVGIWQGLTRALDDIGEKHPQATVARVHAKSHEGTVGHWGQQLNEVLDTVAKLGRAMANHLPFDLPDAQGVIVEQAITCWIPPALQPEWAASQAIAKGMGPASAGEVRESIQTRGAQGYDVNGVSVRMARIGGLAYDDAVCSEFNKEYYRGRFPSSRQDGTIIGKHSALQKVPVGLRHLCAPEVLQNIVSSIVGTRIIQMTLAMGVMARAQKCNIPGIAGTTENNFLINFLLYDFFAAARYRLLDEGAVRILMLSDISKAFDRVQLAVLLLALKTLFQGHDITRLLAAIDSLYEQTRIAISRKEVATLCAKLAGVHQGDPASAILFALLMEFVRRLIPPSRRYKIKFYMSEGETMVLLEIDYADDQIRVTDGVMEMQHLVSDLSAALAKAGLQWNPKKVFLVALKYSHRRGVQLFDPGITAGTNAQGELVHLEFMQPQAVELDWNPETHSVEGEVFKTLGVWMSWRMHAGAAGLMATSTNIDRIDRIMGSDYPFGAKLRCLQLCVTRLSEHVSFTAWIPPSMLGIIDQAEQHSIRAFLGFNIPCAVLKGPGFKLAMRVWRQEIIHLTGFVRALGSPDQRLKAAALAMSKSADPCSFDKVPRSDELLDPPFFEWKDQELAMDDHPTAAPERFACLARKWGVGITEVDRLLVITVDGTVMTDPSMLLKRLTKNKEKALLQALERRDSTDVQKNNEGRQAPPFSFAWGIAGWVDKHRHERVSFYGPRSPFSDKEIQILLRLRLLLWPTAFRQSIYSGGTASARCVCGARCQTATHLLNVPWDAPVHSLALREIPRVRHNEALQHLVRALFAEEPIKGSWMLVQAEGTVAHPPPDPHPTQARLNRKIRAWVATQALSEPDGTQHYRTDLLVASMVLKQVLILDVCFGSDDKLAWEDELIRNWMATRLGNEPRMGAKFWKSSWFDDIGKLTTAGAARLPELDAKQVFKHARYVRRYARLERALRTHLGTGWKVRTLPIAVGVIGLVPDFTRHNLAEILPAGEVKSLVKLLIQTSQRAAIQAWRAWKQE
jgi:hypothetical protein